MEKEVLKLTIFESLSNSSIEQISNILKSSLGFFNNKVERVEFSFKDLLNMIKNLENKGETNRQILDKVCLRLEYEVEKED